MTKDEALKMALEALVLNNAEWKHLADYGDSGDWSAEDQDHYKHTEEAITAIKEALANVATNDTSQERVDKTSESVHEPWSPVSIGVDITKEGAHVVGIYTLDKDTSQVFYAKHHPAPQRTWVGLTDEEFEECDAHETWRSMKNVESKLKEKNT